MCSNQVWKIEDFLAKWEGTCSKRGPGDGPDDAGTAAIALVLLKEIDSYRCACHCMPVSSCPVYAVDVSFSAAWSIDSCHEGQSIPQSTLILCRATLPQCAAHATTTHHASRPCHESFYVLCCCCPAGSVCPTSSHACVAWAGRTATGHSCSLCWASSRECSARRQSRSHTSWTSVMLSY